MENDKLTMDNSQFSINTYPLMKDSEVEWIGEIPEGWEVKKLKYVADVVLGKMLTNNDKGGYEKRKYLRAANIEWRCVNVSDVKEMWFSADELVRLRIKKGDLLVSEGGEVGRTCIWNDELEECYIQNSVHKILFFKQNVSTYFLNLFFFMGQKGFFDSIVNRISIAHLTGEKLKEISVVRPPPEHQTTIANYLDRKTAEIDELIAQKERLLELYEEEKTAIINQAVTKGIDNGKLRIDNEGKIIHSQFSTINYKDSGIDWLGEIPEGWEVVELRRLISYITSGSRGWAEYYANEGDIFIRIGNLTRNSINIDLSDVQYVNLPGDTEGGRTKIVEGDILFSITAYIGSVAVATDKIVGAYINQHVALVRPIVDKVFSKYIAYVSLSDFGQSQLLVNGYGGTKIQLALDDVKSLLIPFPLLNDQTNIVHHIEIEITRINAKIAKTKRIIELQKEYRTALISEVVTGKLRIVNG